MFDANFLLDFIDEHPQLFRFQRSQNRAQKLLNYLGEVLVNGPQTPLATKLKPAEVHPHLPVLPLGMFFCCWFRSIAILCFHICSFLW